MILTYRKLEQKDIRILTPIMKSAFDEDTRMHTDLAEDGPRGYDTGELLEHMMQLKNALSFVILCDNQEIGEYTIIKDESKYTLELLFIDQNKSSKGIGQQVWNDIEMTYQDAKCWLVETPSYSIRNHHFYEKCGFQKLKEIYYDDGASSFIFQKNLHR